MSSRNAHIDTFFTSHLHHQRQKKKVVRPLVFFKPKKCNHLQQMFTWDFPTSVSCMWWCLHWRPSQLGGFLHADRLTVMVMVLPRRRRWLMMTSLREGLSIGKQPHGFRSDHSHSCRMAKYRIYIRSATTYERLNSHYQDEESKINCFGLMWYKWNFSGLCGHKNTIWVKYVHVPADRSPQPVQQKDGRSVYLS